MKSKTTGSLIIIAIAAIWAIVQICSRSVAIETVYPVENAKRSFVNKVVSRIVGVFRASEVSAENVRLRREVASLAILRGDVERLENENASLRSALNYVKKRPEKWVAAGVLSRNGGAASVKNTIRVDKGSLDGIAKGGIVAVPEGLVGRVVQVTPHTAEVLLITDSSLKVACEIETDGKAKIFGILDGGDEDRLRLRYLRYTGEIPPRSRVLTSGRGGIFPPDIEVGTLLAVRTDQNGLSREGEVLPHVAYSALEDVFIRCEK